MNENIKELIIIAKALDKFKYKIYAVMNKEKWLTDFIMENAPCNYDLKELIETIKKDAEKEAKK